MTIKKDPVSRKNPIAAKPITEDEVDEALIDTFPASDPPQWTLGTDHVVGQPSKSRKTETLAMALVKLDKSRWHGFFDRISKVLIGKRAEIEVASLDLGDQVEATWLPLLGFVYEPKTDLLEIALEDVDHLIRKPREIFVDEVPLGLASLEVVDAEGRKHIVRLREPLMLPPP